MRERLDRLVCNVEFRSSYSFPLVIHHEMIRSDHSLLVIDLFHKETKRQKRFRFEGFWVEHDDYSKAVREDWHLEDGSDVLNLTAEVGSRLKQCEKVLSCWGAKNFPNNRKVIANLKRRLTAFEVRELV